MVTRILVFVSVGFTLGVTLGSAVRVMTTPDPIVVEEPDEAGATSGPEAQPSGDTTTSTPSGGAPPAQMSVGDGASHTGGLADGAPAEPRRPAPVLTQVAPATAIRPGGEDASEPDGSARLGKIFAAMDARDAARVLEMLDDHEVRSILSHMTDRHAAAILGHFDPARAATLSRVVLGAPAR